MTTEENRLAYSLDDAADAMRGILGDFVPEVALVLGSGLGTLAESIEHAVFIPFHDVPHMGTSTATSHVGRFVCGDLAGRRVICMQGRLHAYEGYSSEEVAFPVWLMSKLGACVLVTTNAAGAINETYAVGDFCIMADQINFTGRNPVVGIDPNGIAPRFFSMYEAFDPTLRQKAQTVAERLGITVHQGVYLGLLGPSFETPAEIRMFRGWGADTVAMSVCEEVIAARHVGMSVFGMSLCTNMACGIDGANPADDDVLSVGHRCEREFCALITGLLESL